MSYGLFGLSGTTPSSPSSRLSRGSVDEPRGGSARLFDGTYRNSSLIAVRQASSESWVKCETPETVAWVSAPPSCSIVTSSWVTVFTTFGPVTNMYDVPRTMYTKSVIAGEYTAPPAHGPRIAEICGTTPEASVLRRKISAYPPSETTPSWIRAPPESFSPITGAPVRTA